MRVTHCIIVKLNLDYTKHSNIQNQIKEMWFPDTNFTGSQNLFSCVLKEVYHLNFTNCNKKNNNYKNLYMNMG